MEARGHEWKKSLCDESRRGTEVLVMIQSASPKCRTDNGEKWVDPLRLQAPPVEREGFEVSQNTCLILIVTRTERQSGTLFLIGETNPMKSYRPTSFGGRLASPQAGGTVEKTQSRVPRHSVKSRIGEYIPDIFAEPST